MKMKIMLSVIAMSLCATGLFAQTRPSFGLRAGVNFQNLNGKYSNGDKLKNKINTGFNAGVNAEIPVGIDFYLQPGVLFTTKGAKLEDTDDKISLSYVEVPVNFIYKPELGAGHLILGFGPYAAFGVGGKYKPETGDDQDVTFKKDISLVEAASGNVYFKGFDAGANFIFGYETSSKFSLQLNAGLGLVDINPKIEGESPGKSKTTNTGFGISAGLPFSNI